MPDPDSMKSFEGDPSMEEGHAHGHGHGGKRCTLGMSGMCVILVILVATLVVWLFAVNQSGQLSHAEKKAYLSTLGTAHTNFGILLLRNLVSQNQTQNLIVSPLSLSMGLAMTACAASDNSEAEVLEVLQLAQLGDESTVAGLYQQVLDYMATKDSNVIMYMANSMWTSANANATFKKVLLTYFASNVFPLASAATVNAWVSDKTHSLVTSVMDSEPPVGLQLLLLNVVYFKSPWKVAFDTQYTTIQSFKVPSGTKQVEMMHMSAEDFIYKETSAYQMLALPFGKGTDYYAYFILPKDGVTVKAILSGLSPSSFSGLIRMGGDVAVPRIKLTYTQHMQTVLEGMGVQAVFLSQGLTRLSDNSSLALGDVFHHVVIDLNEAGVETAATTTTESSSWFTMLINRPFIFAIRLIITGDLLFLGHIVDPQPA
eukprot:GGOE01004554.1.p1 GENE.GGOE01004554.1~~GGOE01004554.1.p1  ORF type:complete len:449 (+),score=139.28 GGOE01004554.1:66-1349(+)